MLHTGRKRQKFWQILTLLMLFGIASLDVASAARKSRTRSNPKYASIVMDARSGNILHAAHANELRYPASLTKMMTLYMVFEALETGRLKINQRLRVSKRASQQSPTKLYLKSGSTITVRDAILGLVTRSANDAAVVVAEAIGGTEWRFAKQMTQKARKLGMSRTVFGNASGLPKNQRRTTAKDMATLARALYYHYPKYFRYFSTRSFRFRGRPVHNHNRLLGNVPGVDGIKTGFTNAAGRNLVASCVRGGHRIFAVVMGGRSNRTRDQHMINLLNRAYAKAPRYKRPTPIPYHRPAQNQATPLPPTIPAALKIHNVTPSTKPPNYWAVQVGAFPRAKTAHTVANRVRTAVHSLKTARVAINSQGNSKKLYLARLVGLNKTQAKAACKALKLRGLDCLALRSR
ncbi:MAG: D-alanyl-D-alanine carboxypeptidase [Pseudomonadota bacterium]